MKTVLRRAGTKRRAKAPGPQPAARTKKATVRKRPQQSQEEQWTAEPEAQKGTRTKKAPLRKSRPSQQEEVHEEEWTAEQEAPPKATRTKKAAKRDDEWEEKWEDPEEWTEAIETGAEEVQTSPPASPPAQRHQRSPRAPSRSPRKKKPKTPLQVDVDPSFFDGCPKSKPKSEVQSDSDAVLKHYSRLKDAQYKKRTSAIVVGRIAFSFTRTVKKQTGPHPDVICTTGLSDVNGETIRMSFVVMPNLPQLVDLREFLGAHAGDVVKLTNVTINGPCDPKFNTKSFTVNRSLSCDTNTVVSIVSNATGKWAGIPMVTTLEEFQRSELLRHMIVYVVNHAESDHGKFVDLTLATCFGVFPFRQWKNSDMGQQSPPSWLDDVVRGGTYHLYNAVWSSTWANMQNNSMTAMVRVFEGEITPDQAQALKWSNADALAEHSLDMSSVPRPDQE